MGEAIHLSSSSSDVIILGAGAAGLLCAIEAGKRGKRVVVLERNREIGEKIRISGGGRCNFTNINTEAGNYLSANPHFCKSALARYSPSDFIALVERHGVSYHEKKLGQLFCDGSSRQIIALLRKECAAADVEIVTGCEVGAISKDGVYAVSTNGVEYSSSSLVLATGGLSVPKLGATDIGYRVARQFGLRIVAPRPGLVPFVLSGGDQRFCSELSGVSVDAVVSCNGQAFRENILFTHRGLSGPAILQISSYWAEGDEIVIDLAPGGDLESVVLSRQEADLPTVLAEIVPKRLARLWCGRANLNRRANQLSPKEIAQVAADLHAWKLRPGGTEGFGKAEVTCGGVDTAGLSSKTMESIAVPGLFFIGEVVDVTGHLGGYNFQWAWASGFAAGQYV